MASVTGFHTKCQPHVMLERKGRVQTFTNFSITSPVHIPQQLLRCVKSRRKPTEVCKRENVNMKQQIVFVIVLSWDCLVLSCVTAQWFSCGCLVVVLSCLVIVVRLSCLSLSCPVLSLPLAFIVSCLAFAFCLCLVLSCLCLCLLHSWRPRLHADQLPFLAPDCG